MALAKHERDRRLQVKVRERIVVLQCKFRDWPTPLGCAAETDSGISRQRQTAEGTAAAFTFCEGNSFPAATPGAPSEESVHGSASETQTRQRLADPLKEPLGEPPHQASVHPFLGKGETLSAEKAAATDLQQTKYVERAALYLGLN